MIGNAITNLLLTAALLVAPLAVAESESELQAIEKAHVAVTDIKSDFRKALNAAMKNGEAKRALPGCRIKNLNPEKMKVGRTSHRLRNPTNAPPEWTKPYLEKFSTSERSKIPDHVFTKIAPHRYGYAEPIFVEPICLNCHGASVKQEVKEAIHAAYPTDRALDFQVGDFRGLLWLEMSDQ